MDGRVGWVVLLPKCGLVLEQMMECGSEEREGSAVKKLERGKLARAGRDWERDRGLGEGREWLQSYSPVRLGWRKRERCVWAKRGR